MTKLSKRFLLVKITCLKIFSLILILYTLAGSINLIVNKFFICNYFDLYIFPYEQSSISNYYDENKMDAKSHMKILPSDDINNRDTKNKTCFICHMMAESSEHRIKSAKIKLDQLTSSSNHSM